jgi:hypothetical protein
MPGYFEAVGGERGGAAVVLDRAEISILRSFTVQLLELVGPGPGGEGDEGPSGDPLDALFADGPIEPPADPVLARLFPDAYGGPGAPPDEEARARAAEFRRYTEDELRARKRRDGLAVIRALDALEPSEQGGGAVLRLDAAESRQWLGTLNDLRLAIGTRLDIADDDSTAEMLALTSDDPMKPMVLAYLWLGGLQESLVETLMAP